jgi:hypothetical protein
VADSEGAQVVLDGFLAVAAVGGDGPGRLPGPGGDPADGGGELRAVGGVALLHGVVADDAVVVVGDLGLVPELASLSGPVTRAREGAYTAPALWSRLTGERGT